MNDKTKPIITGGTINDGFNMTLKMAQKATTLNNSSSGSTDRSKFGYIPPLQAVSQVKADIPKPHTTSETKTSNGQVTSSVSTDKPKG